MFKYIIRKTASWVLVVFLATNIAYLLAASFLDPKSNYAARRPPLSQDQIDRILEPLNLSENTPLFERWWDWLSGILFHWDWGKSPLGEEVIDQIGHRAMVSAQLLLLDCALCNHRCCAGCLHGITAVQSLRPILAVCFYHHDECARGGCISLGCGWWFVDQ